tara:strand:+ start:1123 stop:1641 length:519 start_codon:yes stop_codon:yes gene_type:complete
MSRIAMAVFTIFLTACAGQGWEHTPMDYSQMLADNEKLREPVTIKIVDTSKKANQSMAYVGAGVLIGRQWSYEQLEILKRLSNETELYLNSLDQEGGNSLTLLVSGSMDNDYRGNYIATLRAKLISKEQVLNTYVVNGFMNSHVASPIAFENAFKVAFDNLAAEIVAPNKAM